MHDIAAAAGVRRERVAAISDVVRRQIEVDRAAAMDRALRRGVHGALVAVAAGLAGMAAAGLDAPVRSVMALIAVTLLPGAAILTALHVRETLAWLALAICLSLAVSTVSALAMAWTGWWHPGVASGLIGGASGAALVADMKRAHRG